jgi:hypothetical protein
VYTSTPIHPLLSNTSSAAKEQLKGTSTEAATTGPSSPLVDATAVIKDKSDLEAGPSMIAVMQQLRNEMLMALLVCPLLWLQLPQLAWMHGALVSMAVYAVMGMMLHGVSLSAFMMSGLLTDPIFDCPHCSASLAEFWGR